MQPFDKHELAELFADVPTRERHLVDVEYVDWGVLDFLGWTHPSGHLGYVAMRKEDDWIWQETTVTFKTHTSGLIQSCIACHSRCNDRDFTCTDP